MMSFYFLICSFLVLIYLEKLFFWYVLGFIFFLIVYYVVVNFMFLDSLWLGASVSLDFVSYSLVVLSLFLSMCMLLASKSVFFTSSNVMYFLFIYILMLVLCLVFLMSNLLVFYFFFEFSLIPTLFIIMGWGYQPERLQAGVYFLFYTLGASLPLLVILIFNYGYLGGLIYLNVGDLFMGWKNFIFFIFSLMAFMVKMPLFFFHLWLPKAHVEAPVAGSMILAGVLLKLGGFGVYRVLNLIKFSLSSYGGYFFGLSVVSMVYVGFICCRMNDLKALVAYSSVSHMGLVVCGLMSFSVWGYLGFLIMMLSHGLSSSGLFCSVNMKYERTSSRSFMLNKGMISFFPIFSMMFFLLCGSNMACPPTMNLLSEIFLMGGMLKYDYLMLLFFPLGSYLGAVFTLFLYSYSQHGKNYEGSVSLGQLYFRECHLLSLHLLPLNLLFLNFDFFLFLI